MAKQKKQSKTFFAQLMDNSRSFNKNQQEFVAACHHVFQQIDPANIAPNSFIKFQQGKLYIFMVHALDRFNVVTIRVDEKDIRLNTVFMPDSMKYQFGKQKGESYFKSVAYYLEIVFKGGFKKVFHNSANGKTVKVELHWPEGQFKNRFYISFLNIFKSILLRPRLTTQSFEYVSFIDNKRNPPICKTLNQS